MIPILDYGLPQLERQRKKGKPPKKKQQDAWPLFLGGKAI